MSKTLTLTGTLMSYDSLNSNNRIYAKETMLKAIKEFQDKTKFGTTIGTLDRNDRLEKITDVSKASHVVRDLRYMVLTEKEEMIRISANHWLNMHLTTNDKYEVDIEILESTPYGRVVSDLLNAGIKLGISSRAITRRTVDTNEITDIELLSFDLISNPDSPEMINILTDNI